MRRPAAALAAGLIVIGVSGCETTQEQSAKIARSLGHQSALSSTTRLGARSSTVRIEQAVLLTSAGQSAVALKLTNTSAQAQVDFPVLVEVRDAGGRSVYRNDTTGIEPSIQHFAALGPHATAWWVDNEVLASGGVPKTATGQLGASTVRAPSTLPSITTAGVSATDSFPGPHVSVTVRNRSGIAQRQLPVYAVALKDGQVLGAGRAIVPALAPGVAVAVQVPMVGAVAGSTISLAVPPTGLG